MKAYSQDLRDRIIELYKTKKYTKTELTKIFKLTYQTVFEWIKRYKESNNYSSKQHIQQGCKARFTDKKRGLEFLVQNPDSQGIDIRDAVAPDIPMSTFYDTLRKMGITYKKKEPKYKGRNEKVRQEFIDLIKGILPYKLVYCDEMGVSNNICTLYGWPKKGERSYAEQMGFATERISIVGGYIPNTKELISPLEYTGNMDKKGFTEWICEHLCPLLDEGCYIIMDNASIHKDIKIKDGLCPIDCVNSHKL